MDESEDDSGSDEYEDSEGESEEDSQVEENSEIEGGSSQESDGSPPASPSPPPQQQLASPALADMLTEDVAAPRAEGERRIGRRLVQRRQVVASPP